MGKQTSKTHLNAQCIYEELTRSNHLFIHPFCSKTTSSVFRLYQVLAFAVFETPLLQELYHITKQQYNYVECYIVASI